MVKLYNRESGSVIGMITQEQLQFLIDELVEESQEDQDYYIDRATLDWFEQKGAHKDLMTLLTKALGSRESIEIRWTNG